MCAYNLVNGVYNCENAHLLNDVLKGDWQFPRLRHVGLVGDSLDGSRRDGRA